MFTGFVSRIRAAVCAFIAVLSSLGVTLGQTGKSFIGTVTAFKPDTVVEIKPDNVAATDIKITPDTVAQRVAPGETSLKNAAAANITDLLVGDRVLVTLDVDGKSARRIVIMSASEIRKRDDADREDWNARGIAGIVGGISGDTITLRASSAQGETRQTVTVSGKTNFRRYAPDSVRFGDAKPSKLDQIAVGDQLRARGEKSADGTSVKADDVVFGTFVITVGSVVSIDADKQQITIKEATNGNTVLVSLTPDSRIRQMPALPAFGGTGSPPPGGGFPGGGPPPAGFPGAGPPGTPGAGPPGAPGGTRSLAQMVETMPAAKIDDVKPGQTIVVSSTKGATAGHITGIMLLANADMLLRMASTRSGAGAAGGRGGGPPQGMQQGGAPGGMDIGGMLGGFGFPGMGP